MDAEHLTAMRTGAASGVATQQLARPDAATATIFGAGAQAGAQLEAVCAVRAIRQAFVFSREGADAYAARMTARLGIPVTVTTDARAAVEAADVICTATNSMTPLFDGAWLRPGTHINAIGAYQRTMRELDTTTMLRSRVFVDGRQAALAEAGEIMIPFGEGLYAPDQVAGEIGDLLLGRVAGRTTPDAITVFKAVGMAVQDAVAAPLALRLAMEQGLGMNVEL
jgi:ornithine cyclodeaminase/alanine dehydrogenase-like protein (mu-crystallin family)